nr:hypothetical protein [Actinoplanes atraurantiacus]
MDPDGDLLVGQAVGRQPGYPQLLGGEGGEGGTGAGRCARGDSGPAQPGSGQRGPRAGAGPAEQEAGLGELLAGGHHAPPQA